MSQLCQFSPKRSGLAGYLVQCLHIEGIIRAWGKILAGYQPNLSIEITRECPLACPGCYAYGSDHLGGDVTLRELQDYKGQELVDAMFALLDTHRPLHAFIVGGE